MYKRKYENFEDDCAECVGKVFLKIKYYIYTFILDAIIIYCFKYIFEYFNIGENAYLELGNFITIFFLYPIFIFLILKDIIYIKYFQIKATLIYFLCLAILFNFDILIIDGKINEKSNDFLFFRNPLYVILSLPFILIFANMVSVQLLKNFSREKDY